MNIDGITVIKENRASLIVGELRFNWSPTSNCQLFSCAGLGFILNLIKAEVKTTEEVYNLLYTAAQILEKRNMLIDVYKGYMPIVEKLPLKIVNSFEYTNTGTTHKMVIAILRFPPLSNADEYREIRKQLGV